MEMMVFSRTFHVTAANSRGGSINEIVLLHLISLTRQENGTTQHMLQGVLLGCGTGFNHNKYNYKQIFLPN